MAARRKESKGQLKARLMEAGLWDAFVRRREELKTKFGLEANAAWAQSACELEAGAYGKAYSGGLSRDCGCGCTEGVEGEAGVGSGGDDGEGYGVGSVEDGSEFDPLPSVVDESIWDGVEAADYRKSVEWVASKLAVHRSKLRAKDAPGSLAWALLRHAKMDEKEFWNKHYAKVVHGREKGDEDRSPLELEDDGRAILMIDRVEKARERALAVGGVE